MYLHLLHISSTNCLAPIHEFQSDLRWFAFCSKRRILATPNFLGIPSEVCHCERQLRHNGKSDILKFCNCIGSSGEYQPTFDQQM